MNSIKPFDYLTSLRGLAAFWVVFYHISQYLSYYSPDWVMSIVTRGHLAVDFFFILSGFILTLNYQKIFSDFSLPLYRVFLLKRIARIYPLHLFVIIAYLLIPLAYFVTGKIMTEGEKYSLLNYIFQLFLINNWGFSSELSWNVPAWSISTEWAAYICFPLFMVMLKRIKISYIPLVLVGLNLLLFVIFNSQNHHSLGQDIQKLGLIRCLIEFFMGALICKYSIQKKLNNCTSYLLLFLALTFIGLVIFDVISEIQFGSISMVVCLIAFINLSESKFANGLRVKPLMLLGEISYSIYLIHFLVRDLFKLLFLQGEVAEPLWIIGYVGTVLVLSYVTYKTIEVPARKSIVLYANSRSVFALDKERKAS